MYVPWLQCRQQLLRVSSARPPPGVCCFQSSAPTTPTARSSCRWATIHVMSPAISNTDPLNLSNATSNHQFRNTDIKHPVSSPLTNLWPFGHKIIAATWYLKVNRFPDPPCKCVSSHSVQRIHIYRLNRGMKRTATLGMGSGTTTITIYCLCSTSLFFGDHSRLGRVTKDLLNKNFRAWVKVNSTMLHKRA